MTTPAAPSAQDSADSQALRSRPPTLSPGAGSECAPGTSTVRQQDTVASSASGVTTGGKDRLSGNASPESCGPDDHARPPAGATVAASRAAYSTALGGAVADAPARAGAPPRPLPCLNSNNCTEGETIPGQVRRAECQLRANVEAYAERYGVGRLIDLTLTFARNVTDRREASKHWRSFRAHVLGPYTDWLRVMERQTRGAIHYHVLLVVPADAGEVSLDRAEWEAYKTAFQRWQALGRPGRFRWHYESASPCLRAAMRHLGAKARAYGFGRATVLPVFSAPAVLAKYYAKYIVKDFRQRDPRDKGARLVETCRAGARVSWSRFAWNSTAARLWRLKVAHIAEFCGLKDLEAFALKFGKRWAFHLRDCIVALKLPLYPDRETAEADCELDLQREIAVLVARAQAERVLSADAGSLARLK